MDAASFRTKVLSRHFQNQSSSSSLIQSYTCLNHSPPDHSESEPVLFDTHEMRKLMDGHHWEHRDMVYKLIIQSQLFVPRNKGGKVFVSPDYNQSMQQQREMTMKRIQFLVRHGVFDGFLTTDELRSFAIADAVGSYDHSLGIKLGVHFFLW